MKDIQTPIMLVHGVGAQLPRSVASELFADRLEMNYKPFVYKTYPNENYYIRRRDNIQTMLGDMLAFFDQHLKDGVREPDGPRRAPGGRAMNERRISPRPRRVRPRAALSGRGDGRRAGARRRRRERAARGRAAAGVARPHRA
jgi:hypothetical protein